MDPQSKIERILKKEKQLYMMQIAKKTGLSPTTVSKYLLKLEALGKIKIKKYATAKIAEWAGEK